jgi:hypothetical protein
MHGNMNVDFKEAFLKFYYLNELSIPHIHVVSNSTRSNTSLSEDAGDVIE